MVVVTFVFGPGARLMGTAGVGDGTGMYSTFPYSWAAVVLCTVVTVFCCTGSVW